VLLDVAHGGVDLRADVPGFGAVEPVIEPRVGGQAAKISNDELTGPALRSGVSEAFFKSDVVGVSFRWSDPVHEPFSQVKPARKSIPNCFGVKSEGARGDGWVQLGTTAGARIVPIRSGPALPTRCELRTTRARAPESALEPQGGSP